MGLKGAMSKDPAPCPALPCHAPRVLRSGSRPGGDLDGGLYRAGAG